ACQRSASDPSDPHKRTRNRSQIFIRFHLPCRKRIALMIASVEYAIASAAGTPRAPRLVRNASAHASGISHTQKMNTLMSVGVHVSPAPLNDCVSTIPYV